MKKRNRIIPLFLAAVLVIVSFPYTTLAGQAGKMQLSDPSPLTRTAMSAEQKVTWDCIWFGSYPQTEVITAEMNERGYSTYSKRDALVSDSLYQALADAKSWDSHHEITLYGEKYRRMKRWNWEEADWCYFKYEPIKWRVLQTDGSYAVLLSELALDSQEYHSGDEIANWENCTLRSWLNGYPSNANRQGKDYSQENFMNSAFTVEEQRAIVESELENADGPSGLPGGNSTEDKVFLLSFAEACEETYGFARGEVNDEARRCGFSIYAEQGTRGLQSDYATSSCSWGLRSPGEEWADTAMYVGAYGFTSSNYCTNVMGIRPALLLDLSSKQQYFYAGIVCSDGTVEEQKETPKKLSNPLVIKEKQSDIVYDSVWFGSYPQTEIITTEMDKNYAIIDRDCLRSGDILVSDRIYHTLENAPGWDEKNEIIIENQKYRRIKKEDASRAWGEKEPDFYFWGENAVWHYFKYEPIQWRVLKVDSGKALLLSERVLDFQRYSNGMQNPDDEGDFCWEKCRLRKWLNDRDGSQQGKLERRSFARCAFSDEEWSAVPEAELENEQLENAEPENNTIDKVFLLSWEDVYGKYGWIKDSLVEDRGRICASSTYAKAMGSYCSKAASWQLRTTNSGGSNIEVNGWVEDAAEMSPVFPRGVRPALYLDLLSKAYSYAGKVSSDEWINDVRKPVNPGNSAGIKFPVQNKNPGNEPQISPEAPDLPTVGTKISDSAGKAVYKVTGANTAEYLKTSNRKIVVAKIPEKITLVGKSYQVTAIASGAFKNYRKLKNVMIGKGITTIGAKAFFGCKSLKKITIKSAKLKKVGKKAFKGIHAKAVIKVPKAKLKAYKKLLKKKGQGKEVRILK